MDAIVLEPELDRVLVGRRRLATGDVDRISGRAERRNVLLERFVEIRRELHQVESRIDTGVGQ